MNRLRLYPRLSRLVWQAVLLVALAVSSGSARAAISATLSWNASPDSAVIGYNIYYGDASQTYTTSCAVGSVTNTIIPALEENTTYFFAAKSRDAAGNQSEFSNEAAFAGFRITTEGGFCMAATTNVFGGDRLAFSLGSGAPSGVAINPTNGIVTWAPGRAYASTTNYITVIIKDASNPSASLAETLLVIVSDYLAFQPGQVAVGAGQSGSLPVAVASSAGVTNMQLVLNWPADKLLNPSLTFSAPVVSGSLQTQNNQLVLQLQTDPTQPLTGTNVIAQINFQAAAGLSSAILSIPANNGAGVSAAGASYVNVLTPPGEVVVVGSDPLLRPRADVSRGRTMSLYATPGNYRLLYATSLVSPITWTPLMDYQQTNVAQSVSLDSSAPAIYYRLQQL